MNSRTEANINMLAGDVHLIAWPVRLVRDIILIVLLTAAVPVAIASWLVYHAVVGGAVDFDSGAMWIISRFIIILYPLHSMFVYFVASMAKSYTVDPRSDTHSTLACWGWQIFGFIIGCGVLYLSLRLWLGYGWSTASILLIIGIVSAIPIGIGFALRSKGAFLKFLVFCGCFALVIVLTLRGGIKEGCDVASPFPSPRCVAKAKAEERAEAHRAEAVERANEYHARKSGFLGVQTFGLKRGDNHWTAGDGVSCQTIARKATAYFGTGIDRDGMAYSVADPHRTTVLWKKGELGQPGSEILTLECTIGMNTSIRITATTNS